MWSAITKKTAEPGDVIQLVIGSADKKTKILYELTNGDEVVERNWLTISRGQKVIDIPVMESYRGGFIVSLRAIKHNRMFAESFNIKVPFTHKKLEITLETYRDFLTPGQKEEWKVKINGPKGGKIAAELLAGMYDASLDKFKSNEWGLNLYHDKRNTSRWGSGLFSSRNSSSLNSNRPDRLKVKHKVYPSINWFGYHRGYGIGIYESDGHIRKQGFAQTSGEMETLNGGTTIDEVEVIGEKIPLIDKKLFIKTFAYMKSKSYFNSNDIKAIKGYVKVIKNNIYGKEIVKFSLNFISFKHNQVVQSIDYSIPKTDYDILKREERKLILNKKLRKIRN